MARRRPRPTDPEIRYRNMLEASGLPALAGLSRVGLGGSGRGSLMLPPSAVVDGSNDADAAVFGQLLVLSATGDSIASGGDYVTFGSLVYRHGFEESLSSGQAIVWPTSSVGSIAVEFEWDTYEGGGTIAIEVDGTVPAWGTIATGTAGQSGSATIPVHISAGSVVKVKVTQSSGSAKTADVVCRFGVLDPTSTTSLLLIDTFTFDSRASGGGSSTVTLNSGEVYRVTVTGNHRGISGTFSFGSPDDLIEPSPGQADPDSAGADAETRYANTSAGSYPEHVALLVINPGSGYAHPEPIDGQQSTPDTRHYYEYDVEGEGAVLSAKIDDNNYSDNNGVYTVRIYRMGT